MRLVPLYEVGSRAVKLECDPLEIHIEISFKGTGALFRLGVGRREVFSFHWIC